MSNATRSIERLEFNKVFTLPGSDELLYQPFNAPDATDEDGNDICLAKRVKIDANGIHRLNQNGKYVRVKWGVEVTVRDDITLQCDARYCYTHKPAPQGGFYRQDIPQPAGDVQGVEAFWAKRLA